MLRIASTAAVMLALAASAWHDAACTEEEASRSIPARVLPVPDTLSPALQKAIAEIGQGPKSSPDTPRTAEDWKALTAVPQDAPEQLAEMRERFRVTVQPQVIGGVRCYVVTPRTLKPINRNRLLLGLHHGGWVFEAGESGLIESMVIANRTGSKVIAVDYRMLPDHPFPAAMDDAMAVWKAVVKLTRPRNIGVFGSSVGGSMVLSLIQRARSEKLPLPGAVMSGTPWSDLSKTGDSYYTNDGVDGALTYDGFWEAVAKLYANGRDLKDPLLSPVYGDFTDFPPTLLVSGTRDLFLSNAVRVYRKLRQAGVPAQLEVGEGQPHMFYLVAVAVDAPEGMELYSRVAQFFDVHLGH